MGSQRGRAIVAIGWKYNAILDVGLRPRCLIIDLVSGYRECKLCQPLHRRAWRAMTERRALQVQAGTSSEQRSLVFCTGALTASAASDHGDWPYDDAGGKSLYVTSQFLPSATF